MNKIAIPALLLGVVMIAGAFAFMPVQEASTVHTTGTAQGTSTVTKTLTIPSTGAETITFTCGSDAGCVVEEIYLTSVSAAVIDASGTLKLTINGDTVNLDTATDVLGAGLSIALVRDNDDTTQPIVIPAGGVVTLAANASATGDVIVTTISSGVLTATL